MHIPVDGVPSTVCDSCKDIGCPVQTVEFPMSQYSHQELCLDCMARVVRSLLSAVQELGDSVTKGILEVVGDAGGARIVLQDNDQETDCKSLKAMLEEVAKHVRDTGEEVSCGDYPMYPPRVGFASGDKSWTLKLSVLSSYMHTPIGAYFRSGEGRDALTVILNRGECPDVGGRGFFT